MMAAELDRRIPLLPDSTWYGRKIQDLENQIHKLSGRLAINNKPGLDAAEGGMNINRDINSEVQEALDGGMNINRDIKKFLDNTVIWSEQLEALSKHSEQQAKLVTDMVGTLEEEMEELRTKVNKIIAKESTLDNLTTNAQDLEGRVTSEVDNRFKSLELKIQQVCKQEVVDYLSRANGGIDLEKVLRGIPSDINCMKTSRQAAGITQIISKNNDVTEDVFDNSPNIAMQVAEEESETQSGARVDNLEKMVKQLSASLEVTNQTALGADMDKHTKDFLKTEIDAQMAKATGRITETKQGMENNKQQIENIAQELTAKTSNLVTNQRVAKLETEINDNLVKKISKLEAVLVAGEDKINNEDIINLRAEIDIKVNGRIAQIEQDLQKIGNQQTELTDSLQNQITKIDHKLIFTTSKTRGFSSVLNLILHYTHHITLGRKAHAWNEFLNKAVFHLVSDHHDFTDNEYFPKCLLSKGVEFVVK